MDSILFALWFFLPAGIANAAPILAAQLPYIKKWEAPLDGGVKFRGKRLFGAHKTWRGMVSGIFAAILVVYLQQALNNQYSLSFVPNNASDYLNSLTLLLGFLFGFGALAGDAIESAVKRQKNIRPGSAWFPYDQIDYIIGGCIALAPILLLTPFQYGVVLMTWFTMHVVFSYIGFLLHLKSSPI